MSKERGPSQRRQQLREKAKDLAAEYEEMVKDPEIQQQAEELHKKISKISLRDLIRPFDI